MPPHGLYQMPRHHASGQALLSTRPVFNSMDFDRVSPEPITDTDSHRTSSEKGDKVKKKKKKRSLDTKGDKHKMRASSTPATPAVVTTPAASSSKAKKDKDKKSERDAGALMTSTQKRKRQSTAQADAPVTNGNGQNQTGLLNGARFLEGLKSSLGGLSTSFGNSPSIVKSADRSSKKQKKTSRKSEGTPTAIQATKPNREIVGDITGMKTEKKKNTAPNDLNVTSYAKTPKPVSAAKLPAKTPVPVPGARLREASTPYQTPIPLPQKAPFRSTEPVAATPSQQTQDRAARAQSQVLVAETPPSQMSRSTTTVDKTPIPFKLSQTTITPTGRKKTKKGPTIDISPPESSAMHQVSSALSKASQAAKHMSSGKTLLTSSNLLQYKQALNDEPKPRPRGRSSSIAASTLSSDSNRSIVDMFTRINKPYTRSGAEYDPFTLPAPKSKSTKPHETHDEAPLQTFTTAYTTLQKTTNFTDEAEYLSHYTSYKTANDAAGPLPCLNKATGCNPKREQVLRLSKEDTDPSPMLTVTIASATRTTQVANAISACLDAERFLHLAVTARVPVPLGRIDGVWKLYCPDYSKTHIDMYNFGQRTLSISPQAGSTPTRSSTYTARLCIPPRSMAFSIATFDAPPHASFRHVRVKTVAEGYVFELVFLGNGYLKMWVDLQELLLGRRMGGKGGKGLKMEVWGVRVGAVQWVRVVDELEVEGRRLCRAYDGE
ncbi:hypothetical protein T440DRAFT_542270 [Plenodomus tracheiphilus IPT5]|uniref:Uncharacterized protein n=1 Tax=Plenodomus tracheiphilus IPT5 TaxID=1408161 RepID=A0A6A7BHJ0_9PLEO|nr:hypothetical protein T440DRAFT_542270 [Plenodomus tracheiphilus IPT5]